MIRDETVKARVSENEKKKIEDYLEESNEFDSMSRFLRVLAHNHIDKNENETASIDSEQLRTAVEDGISSIDTQLNEISERIADVEQSIDESDEISDLANDIYNELLILSEGLDGEVESIKDLDRGRLEATGEEEAKLNGSPQSFAKLFDEDINDVRRALSRSMELYPDVEYVQDRDGMRRYYRDER